MSAEKKPKVKPPAVPFNPLVNEEMQRKLWPVMIQLSNKKPKDNK